MPNNRYNSIELQQKWTKVAPRTFQRYIFEQIVISAAVRNDYFIEL